MDRKYRQGELLCAVEHDADEIIGLHTGVDELMSQRIRIAVHLAVGQLTVLIDNSRCIGRSLCLFCKEVGESLVQIDVDMLACTYLNELLGFFLADNADGADCIVRTGHHLLHRCLDGISHHTHRLTAVHCQTRLHTDVVVVVGQEDMCQHIVEDVSPILLYKRTMVIAEVVGLFPSGQGGEVERDAGLYTQVATEV